MAELITLARPYARAAFEFASERNELTAWSTLLNTLAAVAADSRVSVRLSDPSMTAAQQADLLIELAGSEMAGYGINFIRTLANYKRLPLLREIATLFDAMKAQQERTVDVEVISAMAMSEEQQKGLASALVKHLNREVTLVNRIDATLIGGAVVRAGDTVIDGSVRGRLNRLAEATNS